MRPGGIHCAELEDQQGSLEFGNLGRQANTEVMMANGAICKG